MNDRYVIASPRPGRYLSANGTTSSPRAALRFNDSDRAEAALRKYYDKTLALDQPQLLLVHVEYTTIPACV